jgi:dsRNA-specific ribonuclease
LICLFTKELLRHEKGGNLLADAGKAVHDGMIDSFHVRELREELRIPTDVTREKLIDCAQAIIASVVMTCGSRQAEGQFAPQISELIGRAEQALSSGGRHLSPMDRIIRLQDRFDPALPYAQILQEYAQSKGEALPDYKYIEKGSGHAPVHQALAIYDGHHVQGSGARRSDARNAAAFELIMVLKRTLHQGDP